MKNLFAPLLVALALSASALFPCGVSAQSEGMAGLALAEEPLESLEVDARLFTSQSFDWYDAARQRAVPAKLYLPASTAQGLMLGGLPLVVFSHGIGGSKEGYSYLGRYFAAHGYASLHVQHVGSDRELWRGNPLSVVARLTSAAQEAEAVNRVSDVRFALDQVLSGPEGAHINLRRIVAAGHSYGANTTMLIAGAQVQLQGQLVNLRDDRISAAILISAPPFYGMGDPKKILSAIGIPTLHITATADDIQIPGYFSGVNDRIEIFNATGGESRAAKVLAVFKDGSHSIFTDRRGTGGAQLNPKVKIATRQLALAFLERLQAKDSVAFTRWPGQHAGLLASFEKQAF